MPHSLFDVNIFNFSEGESGSFKNKKYSNPMKIVNTQVFSLNHHMFHLSFHSQWYSVQQSIWLDNT